MIGARKAAAAVSAAGMFLIAGCGGRAGGGSSLPAVPGGLTQGAQPANSARVAMSLRLAARVNQSWTTSNALRRPATTKKAAAQAAKHSGAARPAQSLSPGIIGGSISIFIYQGANLALTDGPFSVGFTYGASDFYCTYDLITFTPYCTNYSPVFAPYGNDTFFVAMYDSQHRLLNVTPGTPGSGTVYDITASGYPEPITVSAYGVAATFGVDASTSCVDPSFTGLYVETDVFDAGGNFVFGPLANPLTISVTGGFSIYALQRTSPYGISQVSSPFTVYDTSAYAVELAAQNVGATGSVSVSGGNALINGSAPSMNLYAVNRLALSPAANGLSVVGLVDNPPASYACGTMNLAVYDTGAPVTFTNPVAIGSDDYAPGAVVVDNTGGTPYVTVVDLYRDSFGLGFFPYTQHFQDAVPVVQTAIPGSNPVDVAVSPYSVGNHKIYVLNGDGSIVSIDTTTAAINTVASSGSIQGPNSIAVLWNDGNSGDYVFATSSSTDSIYEIALANTSPSGAPVPMPSPGNPFSAGSTSAGIFADNFSVSGSFGFLAYDPVGNVNELVSCLFANCNPAQFTIQQLSSGAGNRTGAGLIGGAYFTGTPFFLAGNAAQAVEYGIPGLGAGNTTFAFAGPVTRILSTYDGAWSGIGYGGAFVFNYMLGPGSTVYSPALPGTYATIVSP